jgi:hypothetical protein
MSEYFGTGSKILPAGRGMAKRSLDLIEAMRVIAEAAHPITGRGVGYKLFTAGLIPSMATRDMRSIYRLLKEARERDIIPWEWIVDETRELEQPPSWADPEEYLRAVSRSYRRDLWQDQPRRVLVVSEKGTVRGVLKPVLDKYGVSFLVLHGFSSATLIYNTAQDYDGRTLIALYVGDYDPSGMYMSERDLPTRLEKYGGDHVLLRRVAIDKFDLGDLPTFPAKDKEEDSRYRWFVKNYGRRCAELDALDPNELRDRVEQQINFCIEPDAWERGVLNDRAEQESLRLYFNGWNGAKRNGRRR